MGLLVECPKCRKRNSPKADSCYCGVPLKKSGHKVYWVEFYDESGKRRRERIGPSKAAAEQRLREVLKARTEGRHIDKDLSARLSLGELFQWYKGLPDVKAKRTYKKEFSFIMNLERLLGKNTKIKEINPGRIEVYGSTRLAEQSPRHPGKTVRASTVNREVACLNAALNMAVRHRKLNANPVAILRPLAENNVRMRLLTDEEYSKLVTCCPDYLRPIVILAFHSGMRKSEIVFLTWDEVDLAKGFIRLSADRTKTKVARSIPLHPDVKSLLRRIPCPLHTDRVFLRHGEPIDDFSKAFQAACHRAELEDFTFHDLRHCALNRLRLAGKDFFKIMAISGHKTMSVFKRYNLVTEDELSKVTWPDGLATVG
jgi:integrase